MDIMGRIKLMLECGLADQTAYDDMVAIVQLLQDRFSIKLTEENGGMMITHMAAVFRRNTLGELVQAMPDSTAQSVKNDPSYDKSVEILEALEEAIQNRLSTHEQDYVLLHLCTLLYGHNNIK